MRAGTATRQRQTVRQAERKIDRQTDFALCEENMACRSWPPHIVPTRCTRHSPEHTNYAARPSKQAQASKHKLSCMYVGVARRGAMFTRVVCEHAYPKGGAGGPGGSSKAQTDRRLSVSVEGLLRRHHLREDPAMGTRRRRFVYQAL